MRPKQIHPTARGLWLRSLFHVSYVRSWGPALSLTPSHGFNCSISNEPEASNLLLNTWEPVLWDCECSQEYCRYVRL